MNPNSGRKNAGIVWRRFVAASKPQTANPLRTPQALRPYLDSANATRVTLCRVCVLQRGASVRRCGRCVRRQGEQARESPVRSPIPCAASVGMHGLTAG